MKEEERFEKLKNEMCNNWNFSFNDYYEFTEILMKTQDPVRKMEGIILSLRVIWSNQQKSKKSSEAQIEENKERITNLEIDLDKLKDESRSNNNPKNMKIMNEEERRKIGFAVYYNNMNPHVFIHKIGIHKLEKNGGNHEQEQGGWGYFVEEREAKLFAEAIGNLNNISNVRNCDKCFKD